MGPREDLKEDYIVFATTAAGINREGSEGKLRTFRQLAERHNPVRMAEEEQVSSSGVSRPGSLAVFSDIGAMTGFLRDLKEADLGISINVSGLADEVDHACRGIGILRHSIEHSLGIHGQVEQLPQRRTLELSTMCGHGMTSFNLINKMVELVKQRRLTPAQAAECLAKPCICGAYNTDRATKLLEELRNMG
jgi:hypothetical protein